MQLVDGESRADHVEEHGKKRVIKKQTFVKFPGSDSESILGSSLEVHITLAFVPFLAALSH